MADLYDHDALRLTLDEATRAGARIKVVGVGGGGSNAVTRMVQAGLSGVKEVHYFVNGGGGAYLSFGTSLAWPATAPTADWAYYPNRDAVTRKIQTETPWWKRPAWWWTQRFGAWPFTAEGLSAAFDYNVAPFFQSFVEVKVERSTNRVRVIPYGVHGRLTWGELTASDSLRPTGAGNRELVEWIVAMSPASAER